MLYRDKINQSIYLVYCRIQLSERNWDNMQWDKYNVTKTNTVNLY